MIFPEEDWDHDNFGYDTKRTIIKYNENLDLSHALSLTDLDYEIFIKENSVFFELWKGALSHSDLCKLDINTRWLYIQALNAQIKRKNKEARKGGQDYSHLMEE